MLKFSPLFHRFFFQHVVKRMSEGRVETGKEGREELPGKGKKNPFTRFF